MTRDTLKVRFPVIRLFEAPAVALSPASVLIGMIASVLLGLLGWIVNDILPLDESMAESMATDRKDYIDADVRFDRWGNAKLLRPWTSVVDPAISILTVSPLKQEKPNTTRAVAARGCHSLIQFGLALGLWSCCGTILCRRSAQLFNGDDESTVWRAISYSILRVRYSLGAPAIPLVAAGMIGVAFIITGFVGRMPGLGQTGLMLASPVLVVAGLAMTFLLLATAFGWPLMIAAIATDDCDSFGGLSRAYSGLTGRPWHMAGFTMAGLMIGGLLMRIVDFVVGITAANIIVPIAFSAGEVHAFASLQEPLARLFSLLANGIGISSFWSISTVVYLLLRREVDGVPLERLAMDDELRPVREPFPVVGIPATDVSNSPDDSTKAG